MYLTASFTSLLTRYIKELPINSNIVYSLYLSHLMLIFIPFTAETECTSQRSVAPDLAGDIT